MKPITGTTIVDGKCTPHVNGIRVVVDEQFVPEVNENIILSDGGDELVNPHHCLVVAYAFKIT